MPDNISRNDLFELLDPDIREGASRTISVWLDRGDGCAVYQNEAFDHSNFGHRKFVSYGSPAAQLEVDEPPTRLPDIGGQINWAYQLNAICKEN